MLWFLFSWVVLSWLFALAIGRGAAAGPAPDRIPTGRTGDEGAVLATRPLPAAALEFDAVWRALEQRGPLVARVAVLQWLGRLTVPEIAARLAVDTAAVRRELAVASRELEAAEVGGATAAAGPDRASSAPPGHRLRDIELA